MPWHSCARLVLTLWLVLPGCAEPRPSVHPLLCYDYREDIAPLLETSCGQCHAAESAQGGYRLDSYREVVALDDSGTARVSPGDPEAPLLLHADGAGDHPRASDAVLATLRRWVIECEVSYFASDAVHPLGFVNPQDPDFHARQLRDSGWDFAGCAECHGDGQDPTGGTAQRSCTTCHAAGPTACNTCHGDDRSAAPPRALSGGLASSDPGVGAHRVHVEGGATLGMVLTCSECHDVPEDYRDPGHIFTTGGDIDPPPAEVVFGALANQSLAGFEDRRSGPASYDRANATCSNVYCHASVIGDSLAADPVWTAAAQSGCDTCHGLPPANHYTPMPSARCQMCHGEVVDASLTILDPTLHLDGILSLGDGSGTCSACHGSAANDAPPMSLTGASDVASPAVGLHQAHLTKTTYRGPLTCDDCHLPPSGSSFFAQVNAPGHIDSDLPAEVFPGGNAFGRLAAADGANPVYAPGSATCSNVYCHGGGVGLLADTSLTIERTLSWTSSAPRDCGSCHAVPPLDGRIEHADATPFTCTNCHSSSIDATGTLIFVNGESTHLNGVVDP